jgi:AcrR family transcriptional regulator
MNVSNRPDSETRETILRTAATLFFERGYAKTKVMDIARAVGITPAALYWIFESMYVVVFEYLKGAIETFNDRIAEAIDGIDNPVDRLRTLAIAHTTLQLEFRDQAQAVHSFTYASSELLSALSPERTALINKRIRVHVDRIKEIVVAGISDGLFHAKDPGTLTFAVLNVCEYSALWFRPEGALSISDVALANGEFAVRMATGSMSREWDGGAA